MASTTAVLGVATTGSAGAATLPAPQADVAQIVSVTGTGCGSAVSVAACTDDQWLVNINYARSLEGIGPIVLPANYMSLAPNAQLLVLTNLERSARGYATFAGTNPNSDTNATTAANLNQDPITVGGASGSWAPVQNALAADYSWMYYDAVTTDGTPWSHRDNILRTYTPYASTSGIVMGGAVTSVSTVATYNADANSGTYDTAWSSITIPSAPAPVIVNTSSTSGAGGATITLYGNYFTGATAVDFGSVPGTNVHVLNDSELTVTVPVQTNLFSPAPITVTTPGGASLYNDQETYTYPQPVATVTGVTPNSTTDTTATTPVVITGTNFVNVTGVFIASGQAVTSYTVNSPTSISAVLPAHPEGSGSSSSQYIYITSTGGTSTGTAATFTWSGSTSVNNPPLVTGVTPNTTLSTDAQSVTVEGGYFTGATSVTLSNGMAATFTVNGPNLITATIPANPQAPGTTASAWISVTTPYGTSTGTAATYTWEGSTPSGGGGGGGGTPPPATPSHGYYLVGSDGGIFAFGGAPFYGSTGSIHLNQPIVGMAVTPDHKGYWFVASDGGIFAYGDAGFFGSTGGQPLPGAIVGMAATSDGKGYWLVGSDGSVYAFGDAGNYGSMRGTPLNRPIVGMAATTNGGGYYLVATDGGLFSFGNAAFNGSMGGAPLNRPIVGMATDPAGGYYEVASDGGIFAFGDAAFHGSTGSLNLNRPIVGITVTDAGGYQMVASDGGLFSFGDASFDGSMGGQPLNKPIVGMA